jgi:hypothetical protein
LYILDLDKAKESFIGVDTAENGPPKVSYNREEWRRQIFPVTKKEVKSDPCTRRRNNLGWRHPPVIVCSTTPREG